MKECNCTATAIVCYQKKISGPFTDRIDIHIEVPCVDYEKLADKRQIEDSKAIRIRVQATRGQQLERFAGTKLTCNAEVKALSPSRCTRLSSRYTVVRASLYALPRCSGRGLDDIDELRQWRLLLHL